MGIFEGVPHGSVIGTLLFNVCLYHLLLFVEKANIISCPVDNTPYICSENIDIIITNYSKLWNALVAATRMLIATKCNLKKLLGVKTEK